MNCKQITQSDPTAGSICKALVGNGVKKADLNSPQDVYAKAIDLASAEARRNFERLEKKPKDPNFSLHSPWLTYLRGQGVIIPFIFDDLDPKNKKDIEVLQKVLANKNKIKDLKTLHAFVTSQAGLGISFALDSPNILPHALEAVTSKQANCLEFTYLYLGLGLLLGLTIKAHDMVELYKKIHIIVSSGNGLFDPEDGAPPEQKPKTKILSTVELMALFHYNLYFTGFCKKETSAESLACKERELKRAERYAPDYFRIHHVLYHIYKKMKKPQKAKIHFDLSAAGWDRYL